MMGCHMIKHWSTQQGVIALSSGEAEYYAIVKGSTIAIGIQSMYRDMGVELDINVKTDAAAAKGISSRIGLGKVRHIETNQLWVQEKVSQGSIQIDKVRSHENRADALTKYVNGQSISEHMAWVCSNVQEGRHEIMPETRDQENTENQQEMIEEDQEEETEREERDQYQEGAQWVRDQYQEGAQCVILRPECN